MGGGWEKGGRGGAEREFEGVEREWKEGGVEREWEGVVERGKEEKGKGERNVKAESQKGI